MIRQIFTLALLSIIAGSATSSVRMARTASQDPRRQDYNAWVAHTLEKMETVKPGMTREELLKVFTTEGGLSTGLHQTFVSQDCPYFKVDVDFKAVGRPEQDDEGRVTLEEDSRDIIVEVSRPYLRLTVAD